MNAVLLAIAPNDLEILLVQAQQLEDVYYSESIQSKLNLGENAEILEFLLLKDDLSTENGEQNLDPHALRFAIDAKYAFEHPQLRRAKVRYNSFVEVSEIEKMLKAIPLEALQRRYDREELSHHSALGIRYGKDVDTDMREITQAYGQLEHFYQFAVEHGAAIISLQSDQIKSDVYYMSHGMDT